jgi:hypothetical protein
MGRLDWSVLNKLLYSEMERLPLPQPGKGRDALLQAVRQTEHGSPLCSPSWQAEGACRHPKSSSTSEYAHHGCDAITPSMQRQTRPLLSVRSSAVPLHTGHDAID